MTSMSEPNHEANELDRDAVFQLLVTGQAKTLREAEEMYLDSALPEAYALLASGLSDEEMEKHPLLVMYRTHGSRGWEDSIL
jgi:hypothetical protein